MSITHKVIEASAFVIRKSGTSELLYRDAPVPEDAANLDALIEGGFVEKVKDGEVGGHPSDLAPSTGFTDPGRQAPVVPADPPPAKPAPRKA